MKATQIVPVAMIVMTAVSAVICFWCGDWKKGLYWTGATIIGVAVTV